MINPTVHILTAAIKAYGSSECAVPNIKIEAETTPSDLDVADDVRWKITATLTDLAPLDGPLPTADGPRFSRQWTVSTSDYDLGLIDLCKVVFIDLQAQSAKLSAKYTAIGDAIDILQVVLPMEEPTVYLSEEPPRGRIIEVEADLHPNR